LRCSRSVGGEEIVVNHPGDVPGGRDLEELSEVSIMSLLYRA